MSVNRRGFLKALGLTGAAAVTPEVVRRAVEEAPTFQGVPLEYQEGLDKAENYAPGKTCVCGGTDFSIGEVGDHEQAVCDLCTLELAQVHTEMAKRRAECERQREVFEGNTYRDPSSVMDDIGTGQEHTDALLRYWAGMDSHGTPVVGRINAMSDEEYARWEARNE